MPETSQPVLAHHQAAATMWDYGGRDYDDVSFAISDALAHAAQRLDARAGERILDIATGTGWSARNAARTGAEVVAVDISQKLLAAARELSAHVRPQIDFRLADAERLPVADGSFDGVISTFGAMFAVNQAQVAAEMARVCRTGGRLVLATWPPAGAVAEFFGLIGRHSDAPPPPVSPLAWGDPAHVTKLLGGHFDLTFERGLNNSFHGSTADIWEWYARGFGPLRQLASTLDADRLVALRRDVDAYHGAYRGEAGLHVKREYLLVMGRRL